jgi:hypothetical protein
VLNPPPDKEKEGEHSMEHELKFSEADKDPGEERREMIMRQSAKIYIAVALAAAGLFFLAAYAAGSYTPTAKLGGMVWVGLLSLIIAMPLVTDRVKKRMEGKGVQER